MSNQAKADALRFTISTEGWRITEQYIQARIDEHKGKLMTCALEDVEKHRAAVRALELVFLYIKQTIEEGLNEDESSD